MRFEGVITFAELAELGRLHAAFPVFAAADAIHVIDEAADLSRLQLSELDLLRAHYAKIQSGLDLYMVRRSAWVCSTAATCRLVEHWLDGRHSRDGQQTEVVMAADLADVFPLFSEEEIEEVLAGAEFTQISRIGAGGSGRVVW